MPSENINFYHDGTIVTVSNESSESSATDGCQLSLLSGDMSLEYVDIGAKIMNNQPRFKLIKFTASEYDFLKAYIRAVYFNLFDIDFYINSVNLMLCLNPKKYKDFYLLKLTDSEILNILKLFNKENIRLKKDSSRFLRLLIFSPQRGLVESLLESSIYSNFIEIEE